MHALHCKCTIMHSVIVNAPVMHILHCKCAHYSVMHAFTGAFKKAHFNLQMSLDLDILKEAH